MLNFGHCLFFLFLSIALGKKLSLPNPKPLRFIFKNDQEIIKDVLDNTRPGRLAPDVNANDVEYIVVEFNTILEYIEFAKHHVLIEVDNQRFAQVISMDVPEEDGMMLQESIPWGVSNVFERDGVAEVPEEYASATKRVCVIDSGYQMSNEDLPNGAETAGGHLDWYNDVCSHGTHVTGTILANRGNEKGVIGVYPNQNPWIVKALGNSCGWTWSSTIVQAMQYCVDKGAKVINMSLGGSAPTSIEQNQIKEIYEQDVLIIAAAGNAGNSNFAYPASYDFIMSVGATDENNEIAFFSQYNNKVDISAPGVDVLSTYGTTYKKLSGTSMAAPHVSGVALLLWNTYTNCTVDEIWEALVEGAQDFGEPGWDPYFGHGIVKYWQSSEYLQANPCGVTPSPTISPAPSVSLSPTKAPCEHDFQLTLTTDNYPSEITWSVRDREANNATVFSGDGYYLINHNHLIDHHICNGIYEFSIQDSFGDGLCCENSHGHYELYLDGHLIKQGGDFADSESHFFALQPFTSAPTASPSAETSQGCPFHFKMVFGTSGVNVERSYQLRDSYGYSVLHGYNLHSEEVIARTACLEEGEEYTFNATNEEASGFYSLTLAQEPLDHVPHFEGWQALVFTA